LEVEVVRQFIILEVEEQEVIQVVPSLQLQQHTLLLLVDEVVRLPILPEEPVLVGLAGFLRLLVLD
jgi:hypothetical protein